MGEVTSVRPSPASGYDPVGILRKTILEAQARDRPATATGTGDAAEQFTLAPTHGTAADVLHLAFGETVIAEKTALDGHCEFFIRDRGTCYFKPFPTIRREARDILEAAVDRALESLKEGSEDPKKLYSAAGKAKAKARTRDFQAGALAFLSDKILVSPSIPWNTTPEVIPTETELFDFSGKEPMARMPEVGEYFKNPAPCSAAEILQAKDASRFHDYLAGLFVDEDTRQSAQECLAMCLAGVPRKTFQIWTNAEGDGGKDTLKDLARRLVPGRVIVAKNALILYRGDAGERRFGEIELQGRSGVFFDEVGGVFDISQIKRYTSLSSIRGEAKGCGSVEFPQTWATVALCNELPRFYPANDGGFLSRILVLPFSSVFYTDDASYQRRLSQGISPQRLKPAADKEELLQSLLGERPAILATLAQSWIVMRSRGGKPSESPECIKAKEVYRHDNDLAERFFDDYLIREEHSSLDYGTIKDLWSEFTGEKNPPMRDIVAALVKRFPFITPIKSHGVRKLRGIDLRGDNGPENSQSGDAGDQECQFPPRDREIYKNHSRDEKPQYGSPQSPELDFPSSQAPPTSDADELRGMLKEQIERGYYDNPSEINPAIRAELVILAEGTGDMGMVRELIMTTAAQHPRQE